MIKHVVIDNIIFPYESKAPFATSGRSIHGALEYNKEKDQIRCHECGEWFKFLCSTHLKKHSITAEKYKAKHGLLPRTALVAEGLRTRLIEIGKSELRIAILKKVQFKKGQHGGDKPGRYGRPRHEVKHKYKHVPVEELNKRRICPEQVIDTVKKVAAAVGRMPTSTELQQAGLPLSYLSYYYGGVRHVAHLAGLKPNGVGETNKRYRRDHLLDFLKNFFKTHGRSPSNSDCRRGMLPSHDLFYKEFGSWNDALRAAGLPLNYFGVRFWDKKKLVRALRRFRNENGRLPSLSQWRTVHSRRGWPSCRVFISRFGSWGEALRASA